MTRILAVALSHNRSGVSNLSDGREAAGVAPQAHFFVPIEAALERLSPASRCHAGAGHGPEGLPQAGRSGGPGDLGAWVANADTAALRRLARRALSQVCHFLRG